ncbi:MAG: glycosyltransferase family 9 protein [Candidatus Tantalella remota]|nr:glycosyltransferase family 9 protein [Candidatus Tantalella remota]
MKYVYKKNIYKVLFTILDGIGKIVVFPMRWSPREETAEAGRILVIRCDHIGDVISSSVVLKPLRKAYPEAVIDLMTSSAGADILKGDSHVDNVIPFTAPWFVRGGKSESVLTGVRRMARVIRNGKYDVAIDLRGDVRHIAAMLLAGVRKRISYGITGGGFLLTDEVPYSPPVHETIRNIDLLAPLGIFPDKIAVELRFADSDIADSKALVRASGIKGSYAVIHSASGRSSKNWSPDNFAGILRFLADQKNMIPVVVGGTSDKETIGEQAPETVDLRGKTGLGMLGPIISEASFFIGLDSGPAHIAAAVGTPTVILFSGTDDPDQWAPNGGNVRVICPGEGKDLSCVTLKEVMEVINKLV